MADLLSRRRTALREGCCMGACPHSRRSSMQTITLKFSSPGCSIPVWQAGGPLVLFLFNTYLLELVWWLGNKLYNVINIYI